MVVAPSLLHGPARFTPTCCEYLSARSSATQTKSTHRMHSERLSQRAATHGYATELAVRLLLPTTLSAPRAALLQGGACLAASSPPNSTPPGSTGPRIAAPLDSTTPRIYPGSYPGGGAIQGYRWERYPLKRVPQVQTDIRTKTRPHLHSLSLLPA